MTNEVLSASKVTVRYPGGFTAVREVEFAVQERQHMAIIGPNGAGKSTLLKALTGEARIASGSIAYLGTDITRRSCLARATAGLVRTRQELGLFHSLSVRDNILCGADRQSRASRRGESGQSAASADEVIAMLGLEQWAHALPRQLPYGSRKLVEFGRALATGPRLLLLDEPVAGLNTAEKRRMADIVRQSVDRLGTTLVLVEHDMTTVRDLCPERVVAMVAGAVVAHGPFADVVKHEAVRAAYLGEHTAGGTEGDHMESITPDPASDRG